MQRIVAIACLIGALPIFAGEVEVVRPRIVVMPERLVEARDISFHRLPATAGISQTRVSLITQDDDGFLWFGTQSGLNRYDGYKCKVFKHDHRKPGSLSGVFLYSLFKDRAGGLWAGSDQYLDKFDPLTETFHRVRVSAPDSSKSVNFGFIDQDHAGRLWLPTSDGLYGLDATAGHISHYRHDPNDPSSINQVEVQSVAEDKDGALWVGMPGGFDLFDRLSGKVRQRIQLGDTGLAVWLHEDRFKTFWVRDGNGLLGILDQGSNRLTRFSFQTTNNNSNAPPVEVLTWLEDRDGTMWFGTSNQGLIKYDREHARFLEYGTHSGDAESLPDDRIIALFQDREGSIWAGLHQATPVYFSPQAPSFEKFTYQPDNPNSLSSALVSVIHEDRDGMLWMGGDRSIKRIDRKSGKYITFPGVSGHEVLSIVDQSPDVMWMGTGGMGLKRYNRKTGRIKTYLSSNDPGDLCSNFVEKLLIDRKGRLWEAAWGGLCYLDLATARFTRVVAVGANRTYHAIAEDHDGMIWVGSNLGLQRVDPASGKVTEFVHNDDQSSVSDNRINSIYEAQDDTLWIGTQNGLDRFEPATRTFTHFGEDEGIGGNVVACILEDNTHQLWMSTNAGVSSFNRHEKRFSNYSAADGLPGPDLTGWGACFKSESGEMFFGGFSGAVAFHPERIINSPYVPAVVLTEFRLFGLPVDFRKGSPLTHSIAHTQTVSLSHTQNFFSIEFSALSFVDPAANRYRYRLEGLQPGWLEVGSAERLASYTTLPTGNYTFRVQGATNRSAWSEPGTVLHIQILPPWWGTVWFKTLVALATAAVLWMLYRFRLQQMTARVELGYSQRLAERTRIARDLHDTLLQSFQGLILRLQVVSDLIPSGRAKEELEGSLERADQAMAEGRKAVYELRSPAMATTDLALAVRALGNELVGQDNAVFSLVVEGTPRDLHPIIRDEAYRIAREALRNALTHARAQHIESEIAYAERMFRLRIRDDGRGIPPEVLEKGRSGHYGLPGMRERARQIGAKLTIWSGTGTGTEIELNIPGSIAYGKSRVRSRLGLFRRKLDEA